MVRLYAANDVIEAHLLKHMLEQQNIAAFTTGEFLEGAVGELPAGGLIDVWVLAQHLPDAKEVLTDFFDTLDAPDDDELMDEAGYYLEDRTLPDDSSHSAGSNSQTTAPDSMTTHEPNNASAAHDPANPWNDVYLKT